MEPIKPLAMPLAVLIAGLALALAILSQGRYVTEANANALWRVDRLTGDVVVCAYGTASNGGPATCERAPVPPG